MKEGVACQHTSLSRGPLLHSTVPVPQAQWVELLSPLSLSTALSLMAGVVAGSCTWSDVISSSGSAVILSTVAPCSDGLSVEADLGSLSLVGSSFGPAQQGDLGLGSGSGVEPARSNAQMRRNLLEGHSW